MASTINFAEFVRIAADSIEQLRECDVYRLVSTCPASQQKSLVAWISYERPEFASEANECFKELRTR